MKCAACENASEGFAVIPAVGEAGEIRFYCDPCARRDRVKMRYWDGRDLDVGGWRDDPDLGEHFHALIFSFPDLGRLRRADLAHVMEWAEDAEIAAALVGTDAPLQTRVLDALSWARARRVRELVARRHGRDEIDAAQRKIVELVRKL